MAQQVDFALLKHLNQQAGLRYYAPEVGPSMAYFLNQYLETGDEELIKTLTKFYTKRVPQDGGIEWMEKWQKIRKLNILKSDEDKIKVVGTDKPIADELILTHLSILKGDRKTGIALIDSLDHFKELQFPERPMIWSGKPIWESGKPWTYFFPSPAAYFDELIKYLTENETSIYQEFGKHGKTVANIVRAVNAQNRERTIYQGFKDYVLPLINQGEKVYSNFGYFHIQQSRINSGRSVAAILKEEHANSLSMVSIQGMLIDSKVLKEKKWKKAPPVQIKELTFTGMAYNGYKQSASWDGDSFWERVKGVRILKKVAKTPVTLVDLNQEGSPFKATDHLASFSRGKKKWRLEEGKSTTDFFQYVILMQKSKAIRPLEELEK